MEQTPDWMFELQDKLAQIGLVAVKKRRYVNMTAALITIGAGRGLWGLNPDEHKAIARAALAEGGGEIDDAVEYKVLDA
jgi:hypothetical protein